MAVDSLAGLISSQKAGVHQKLCRPIDKIRFLQSLSDPSQIDLDKPARTRSSLFSDFQYIPMLRVRPSLEESTGRVKKGKSTSLVLWLKIGSILTSVQRFCHLPARLVCCSLSPSLFAQSYCSFVSRAQI